MTKTLAMFRLDLREKRRRLREKVLMTVAWALPRSLAYWCAVRVGAHATTGQYGNTVVPSLRFMDALERWGHP